MRVTERMIFDSAQSQIAAARDQMQKMQQQVASGERVVAPGDDPGAAGLMVSYQIAIQRHDAIDQTASRASDETQVADGALQNVSTLLQQAKDLAVQLGNDTYSASERAAGAQEITSISNQIVAQMNTQVAGRYIFGGNVDRTAPFDPSGNYAGDTAVRQVEVAPGVLQDSSIRADQALKGVGGGVDAFASLSTLATALASNDAATIRSSVGDLTTADDQVAQALTQAGGIMDALQSAQTIGGLAKDTTQKLLSGVADAMRSLTERRATGKVVIAPWQ